MSTLFEEVIRLYSFAGMKKRTRSQGGPVISSVLIKSEGSCTLGVMFWLAQNRVRAEVTVEIKCAFALTKPSLLSFQSRTPQPLVGWVVGGVGGSSGALEDTACQQPVPKASFDHCSDLTPPG